MRSTTLHIVRTLCCCLLVACSEDAGELEPDHAGEWHPLIQGDWELEPNSESFVCVRVLAREDLFITALKPVVPVGTHHVLVSIDDWTDMPEGTTECTAADSGRVRLAGAAVSANEYEYPDGVAVRVRAGQMLLLNLHLFNATEETMRGTSGLLVRTVDEAAVDHFADQLFAGPITLDIPPGRVTQRGRCTLEQDATVFGVAPHMHRIGAHLRAVANTSAGEVLLYDGPFDFNDQQRHPIENIELKRRDTIEVECTYENEGPTAVQWGTSSTQEMCYIVLLRFPEGTSGECNF